MNILKKADQIVNERSEEKERQYGPFSECNRRAAQIASILAQKEITTEDIFYFQIALKLARESHAHKEDNLLDAVAYIGALNNYHEEMSKEDQDMKIQMQDFTEWLKALEHHDRRERLISIYGGECPLEKIYITERKLYENKFGSWDLDQYFKMKSY